MRKGTIIVDAGSPLAAYLDGGGVQHVQVAPAQEIKGESTQNPSIIVCATFQDVLCSYASMLAMYALQPLCQWACGQSVLLLDGRGMVRQALELLVCICGALLCGRGWLRIMLFTHVNVALLLVLMGKLCAHRLHKLNHKLSHTIGVLHKYQTVLMGFPVSAPLVSAKVLEARCEEHLAGNSDTNAMKVATSAVLLQLHSLCSSMAFDEKDLDCFPGLQPSRAMRVSELQALHHDLFHALLPEVIASFRAQLNSSGKPLLSASGRLCRFVIAALAIQLQEYRLAANDTWLEQTRVDHQVLISDQHGRGESETAMNKMFSALSAARRHVASMRAAFETSVLELWQFEYDLVNNHRVLSISQANSVDRAQLLELQQLSDRIERLANDAVSLDQILALRLQMEQDITKMREALRELQEGPHGEMSNPLDAGSFLHQQVHERESLASSSAVQSDGGANGRLATDRTVFEHGADDGNSSEVATGFRANANAENQSAIEVLTAIVGSQSEQAVDHAAGQLPETEQRLQRFFRAHLMQDLTVVLATVQKDRVFRIRKLIDDRMVDAQAEDAQEDVDLDLDLNLDSSLSDAASLNCHPFANPMQSMPRLNLSDLQSVLSTRTNEEEVISTIEPE